MSILSMPRSVAESLADGEQLVCVFCDNLVTDIYCAGCMEYKGLMTIPEWEAYTGEVWDA